MCGRGQFHFYGLHSNRCLTNDEIILQGLSTGRDAPLEVAEQGIAGRGVFATGKITAGEWLCEYRGKVIPLREKKLHEEQYVMNDEGSYIVTSQHEGLQECVGMPLGISTSSADT